MVGGGDDDAGGRADIAVHRGSGKNAGAVVEGGPGWSVGDGPGQDVA